MLWSFGFIISVPLCRKSVFVNVWGGHWAHLICLPYFSDFSFALLSCPVSFKHLFYTYWFMMGWLLQYHYDPNKIFFQAFFIDFNIMYIFTHKTFKSILFISIYFDSNHVCLFIHFFSPVWVYRWRFSVFICQKMSLFQLLCWRAVSLCKVSIMLCQMFTSMTLKISHCLLASMISFRKFPVISVVFSCLFQGYLSLFPHLHLRFFFIIAFHEFGYDASPHFIYLFLEFWVFPKSMAWHLSIDLENPLALSFQILFFPFFLFSTGTSINSVLELFTVYVLNDFILFSLLSFHASNLVFFLPSLPVTNSYLSWM